ncbi:MAG: DUF1460 domain-containing protein [Ignavibacteriales bacterium]|nr:DUF1460 domain-containing protein [Ignavibacteriales bacterium]MCB9219193.1 DUF1460 domain-containing protein [Ignavibacteriales bacterium]MCB9259775.1 DUF1460 domain-containing protein [Ignavibacteriales bacterium]
MIHKIIITLFILVSLTLNAQVLYTDDDVEICNTKFEFAVSENLKNLPINDVVVEIGKTFLGLDYEAYTLEKSENEQLIIHLTGLDCYTFFESSLAFARCIKSGKTTFQDFQNEIQNLRYRNGVIEGYPSRLHYAADWLYDNNNRNIVKDITEEIGGIKYSKKINFMTNHVSSYKQLKNNPEFVEKMKEIESSINSRDYYYVPENDIECIESEISNGDIILITASTAGLDISHTGIAVKMEDDRIHFMHAPLAGKKIQITEQPLSDYVKGLKRHTGIMVARVLEP